MPTFNKRKRPLTALKLNSRKLVSNSVSLDEKQGNKVKVICLVLVDEEDI